jgi:hypothetical protein
MRHALAQAIGLALAECAGEASESTRADLEYEITRFREMSGYSR